jgi:hypothetical protein
MTLPRLLPALLLLALAAPALAEDRCPRRGTLDCAGQARAMDAAIAADPAMAVSEAAIAARAAALQRALAPEAAAALARADALRRRARSRYLFFTPAGEVEPESVDDLRDALGWHLSWLGSIDPAPPPGVAGRWDGGFVMAKVVPRAEGGFDIEAHAVEPFHLAWTCEFDDTAAALPDGSLVSADGTLRLVRDGPLLILEPIPRPGLAGYDYCGAMGSLTGALFFVGALDAPPRLP